ncbi:dTDP-4-dehydrorhamnose reductase [Candidatus Bathyarchaeota archaeon]|nr:dTDP-4-dehydrorhamnose reductase [Candidatus Bathyarchaeota archaeon]
MRIAIIGSTGQLGTDLMRTLREKHEVIGLTHQNVEVTDYNDCQVLKKDHPDLIINTAAFHKTDQCEDEPLKAFAVNAVGAKNVTTISKEIQATTIYISTDYVFDGKKSTPYTETDTPTPINTYGISKLAGEFYTEQNLRHYVIRVASLFGVAGASGKGGNFVETMITKAKKNEPLSVVNDMWMSPTYTKDAATAIEKIVEKGLPFGTYHAANQGYCTWFQFAEEILKLAGLTTAITPTKTDQLQTKTQRPIFSALRSEKLSNHGIRARGWKDALADYLDEKGYLDKNGSRKQI